jgi:hypothetical protein
LIKSLLPLISVTGGRVEVVLDDVLVVDVAVVVEVVLDDVLVVDVAVVVEVLDVDKAAHVQLARHCPGQAASTVPSHCSPVSRMLLPQIGGGQAQSCPHRPGQAASAVPSHCSAGSRILSPQSGGGQVQSARHCPGQAASAVPSHCSPASRTLSPHVHASPTPSLFVSAWSAFATVGQLSR